MDIWSVIIKGVKYNVLTIIDRATRWAEATIISESSAQVIASALTRVWVTRFGVPRVLVADCAKEFTSEVLNELCKVLGVRYLHSSIYHPQGNAPVETFHRSVAKGLLCIPYQQLSFLSVDEALQLALMSYCSTIHLELNETPAFMCYSIDLRPPASCDLLCKDPTAHERL